MSTNGSNHQEGHASPPDYQHLAEREVGRELTTQYQPLEDAHRDLRAALTRPDDRENDPTALGPSEFTPEQLEAALDALAAYEHFLCTSVAPLLEEGSLRDRFYEDWPNSELFHNQRHE